MNIQDKIQKIITEFNQYSDWMDKYNLLIEMGKSCPTIDERDKTESFLIKGCQSRVWLKAELAEGKVIYKADSDAVITKGLASLLIQVFSNELPKDIIDTKTDFISQIGLTEHLSPTRSNGLNAMIKQIKLFALAFSMVK